MPASTKDITMTLVAEPNKARLADTPVDWANIRVVYKKLQDDFALITKPFGLVPDERTSLHLSHLIATIDSIDRNLDVLPELIARKQFSEALVKYLRNQSENVDSDHATVEVCKRMAILKAILADRNIVTEFCDTVESVLRHTEAKRAANSESSMIAEMREEWRLTGHLTVLIMRPFTNKAFEKFFYLCCEMMTAVDMIQDAWSDYRTRQISVKPWPTLYLRLLGEFVIPMPRLIARFPKPLNLFRYTASFLWEVYCPWKRST